MVKKYYSIKEVLKKTQLYCAYQERCHFEVKNKLYELGLSRDEIGDVIVKLIEENYLNEERFATHFARGKFRMKYWGRVKISYELKQKQIGVTLIKKALQQILSTKRIRVHRPGIRRTLKMKTLRKVRQKTPSLLPSQSTEKEIS